MKVPLLSIKQKNQATAITLKEHFTVFSAQFKQRRRNILIIYMIFNFCLDPDPKQIIPDPDSQHC